MSYATAADLRKHIDETTLIQLTDDLDTGLADEAIITDVLDGASVEIDGYIGSRNALPLASPPAILAKLCVDIAGWLLHTRRSMGVPDNWQKRYDNAIAFLGKVAQGKISLGAGDPIKSTGADTAVVTGPVRLMGRDGLKDW